MAVIAFDPFEIVPLHWIITVIAALVIVLTVIWLLRDIIWNRRFAAKRFMVSVFNVLAAVCFALAAWNPVRIERFEAGELHLAVVLDVSDSVLRVEGGWPKIRADTKQFLSHGLEGVSDKVTENGSASIITFRGGVAHKDFSLKSLLPELDRLDPAADFASGDGSHIGAGLERAGELIAEAGGRGEILLVSDGNDTEGAAPKVAQQLARRGIPITVLPVESLVPELAITSANLPEHVNAQSPALLRGVIYNTGPEAVSAELRILQNPEVSEDAARFVGPAAGATVPYSPLPGGKFHALRQAITFEGVGIQFVDLELVDSESNTVTHHRRFFTHVNRPLNLLGIGGDLSWIPAISKDFAMVTTLSPSQLSADIDLSQFDGVVISEVPATELDNDVMNMLATAVEQDALGLFLINGDHEGASEEAKTILNSYEGTPIAPLLPVSTEPRPYAGDPPPRHVVIVIDASGSMSGWKLAKAKEIAQFIIDRYLRPRDRLDLIAFTTGSSHLVDNKKMDAAGKGYATRQLNGLAAGGGTDPEDALNLIISRQMKNCGLVFVSDGIFERDLARLRPDCRPTVFEVGSSVVSADSPLHDLADPFAVDSRFDPRRIQMPYFEPEERNKFFEGGTFQPLPLTLVLGKKIPPVPELDIHGAAITYAKDDAELVAVRPKFVDPVLAYLRSGQGDVGVFTAGFTPDWIDTPEGRAAIQAWVERIVPYSARDRYRFEITDNSDELDLRVEIKNKDGMIPKVDHLSAQIELLSGPEDIGMQPVAGAPSTFEGVMHISRAAITHQATLVIEEKGRDALARPQRIPMLVPMQSELADVTITEASSYGLNEDLLEYVAKVSGGRYNPGEDFRFFRQPADVLDLRYYWPWLVALGALLYWLAIATYKLSIFPRR